MKREKYLRYTSINTLQNFGAYVLIASIYAFISFSISALIICHICIRINRISSPTPFSLFLRIRFFCHVRSYAPVWDKNTPIYYATHAFLVFKELFTLLFFYPPIEFVLLFLRELRCFCGYTIERSLNHRFESLSARKTAIAWLIISHFCQLGDFSLKEDVEI